MRGLTGPSGFNGSKGIQGDQGSSGTQGNTGLQGEKGISGSQGDLGSNGTDGVPGEKGTAGAPGDKGNQGTLGPQGPQGPQGLQGPQGAGNFSLCVYDTAISTVTAGPNVLATVVLTEPEVSNFKSYMYILSKQAFLLTHCIQYFTVFNIFSFNWHSKCHASSRRTFMFLSAIFANNVYPNVYRLVTQRKLCHKLVWVGKLLFVNKPIILNLQDNTSTTNLISWFRY